MSPFPLFMIGWITNQLIKKNNLNTMCVAYWSFLALVNIFKKLKLPHPKVLCTNFVLKHIFKILRYKNTHYHISISSIAHEHYSYLTSTFIPHKHSIFCVFFQVPQLFVTLWRTMWAFKAGIVEKCFPQIWHLEVRKNKEKKKTGYW